MPLKRSLTVSSTQMEVSCWRSMGVRRIRLLNWNVNGLRAVLQRTGKTLQKFLDEMEADILCFQETKLTRSELDADLARPNGSY